VRGLIQAVLEHPDGFTGEVVIVENGQGRGSLRCDTSSSYGGDTSVRANANDESHSFTYLVEQVFRTAGSRPRCSTRSARRSSASRTTRPTATDASRTVSYPCFNTAGGRRVELYEGIWTGSATNRISSSSTFPC